MFKLLPIPRLEHVAIREDEPLIVRQGEARGTDSIEPLHLGPLATVDQIAEVSFLIGADFQKNQMVEDRVECFRIIERLIGVVDRFAIDSQSIFGVVLDLDRQVPPNALDEEFVFDGNMRTLTLTVAIARSASPLKRGLRCRLDLRFASAIDVVKLFFVDGPLKGFEACDRLPGLEDHVQERTGFQETKEGRVLVVAKEFREVPLKLWIFEGA